MARGRTYEMAFVIGGKLASSFGRMTGRAKGGLETLQKASRALTAGLGAAVGAMGVAVAAAAKHETGMAKISTMLDEQGKQHLPEISEQIERLSRSYGLGADTLQEAAFQALSASIPFEQLAAFMETSSRSAVGGFTDVSVAVDGLSNVLNAYGLDASKAASVADSFFVANRLGKVTFSQLAGGLGEVNSVASAMGLQFQDVNAYMASVTKRGVLFDQAVTSLSTALTAVADPTAEAVQTAQDLGIAFGPQAIRKMGGFLPWLQHVQQKTGGAVEVIAKLFGGKRGLKGMMPALTSAGLDDIAAALDQMKKGGAHLDAYDVVAKTAAKAWDRMQQSMWSVVRAVGAVALPVLTAMLGDLTGKLFDANGQISDLTKARIKGLVEDVAGAIRDAVTWVDRLVTGAGRVADALGGWDNLIRGAVAALVLLKATEAIVWIESLTGAIAAMDAALLANPVVLIAAAIVVWVAAVALAIVYWDELVGALEKFPTWLKVILGIFALICFSWLVVAGLIVLIARSWDSIVEAVGIAWDAVAGFFGRVWDGVLWVCRAVKNFVLAIGELLMHVPVIRAVVGILFAVAAGIWAVSVWLGEVFVESVSMYLDNAKKLWDLWGDGVIAVVQGVASTVWSILAAPFKALSALVPDSASPHLAALRTQIQGAMDGGAPTNAASLGDSSKALSKSLQNREQARSQNSSIAVDYRPQIMLSGEGANKEGVAAALKASLDDFEAKMAQLQEQRARVAYGG